MRRDGHGEVCVSPQCLSVSGCHESVSWGSGLNPTVYKVSPVKEILYHRFFEESIARSCFARSCFLLRVQRE